MSALDVSDPDALGRALDALPLGCWVRVWTWGETFRLERVPAGFDVEGDVVIASCDIVGGRPRRVVVEDWSLGRQDTPATDTDSEALLLLGDSEPEEAAGLRAWAEARRRGDD